MPCAKCVQRSGMGDLALGTIGDIGLGAVPWTDVLQTGAQTGFDIVKGIFDPRYRQGTAYRETATGDISIQRAVQGPSAGFQVSSFPGQEFSPGASQLLQWGLIAGIAIIGIKAFTK